MNIISWLILFFSWLAVFIFQFKDLLDFKEFGLTGIIALAELGIIFWMIKRFDSIITRILNKDKKGGKDE